MGNAKFKQIKQIKMKYQISCIGKSSNTLEQKIIDKYLNRIKNKLIIKEVNLKKQNSSLQIIEEGNKLIELAPKESVMFLLDKDGINYTTEKFVKMIKDFEMENYKIINFVIGGSWGHGQKIKTHAKIIMSFGKMTWSHLTARIMMIEQLYRVETIFNKHPYHK